MRYCNAFSGAALFGLGLLSGLSGGYALDARTLDKNATPTEAFDAIDAGADILKAFPCGTPENIAVLKSVIPLPVFAVGGVVRSSKRAFLKTADGVGAGIGIYRPELSPEELYRFAKEFMEE